MTKETKNKGRLFTRGKSKRYYLQFYVGGKQIVTRLTDENGKAIVSLREAEKARERIVSPYRAKNMADLRESAYNALKSAEERARELEEKQKPKLQIADMWEKFPYTKNMRGNTTRTLSDNSIRDNRSQWKKFVRWASQEGIEYAEDVTNDHVLAFRDALLLNDLSGDRVNKILMCSKVMFRQGKIEPNPFDFDDLKKMAHKPQGRRELTEDELKIVCDKAEGEIRTLFAIGLYTGLRLGDACLLEWSEVSKDFTRIIRVPEKTSYKNQELVIPIHAVLAEVLREVPKNKRKGYILPETAECYNTNNANLSRHIQKHFESCDIRTQKEGTGEGTKKRASVEVGFHSLRHSFVSICARAGVPLHVVQALCGHSTPAVQRLYLHNSTEDTSKAIAALPSLSGDEEEHTDREELSELAKSLPIEQVRELIKLAQAKQVTG